MATLTAPCASSPAASTNRLAQAGPWRRAWRKLVRNRIAMLGLATVVFFVLLAVFAPWIAPSDPIATSWGAIRKPPSATYWFGTDELGRDVLSRVVWGTRASLMAGVVSVTISLVLSVLIGMVAGFFGGLVDSIISRITDAFLACPFLILAIALAAFLGPSLTNAMIAIGVSAIVSLTLTPMLCARLRTCWLITAGWHARPCPLVRRAADPASAT